MNLSRLLTFAGLGLMPLVAQNQTQPAQRPQAAQRQVLTPQNCYFPPCTPEQEFPIRGTATGLKKGDSIALMDASGKTLTSAPVGEKGEFEMAAPAARAGQAPGPVKTCILRPGLPPACGATGKFDPGVAGVALRGTVFSTSKSGIKTIPQTTR